VLTLKAGETFLGVVDNNRGSYLFKQLPQNSRRKGAEPRTTATLYGCFPRRPFCLTLCRCCFYWATSVIPTKAHI
jgi:hypothetical protein